MQHSAIESTWIQETVSEAFGRPVEILIPRREVLVLGLILSILQVADGVLTAMGVYHFGTGAEGNMLLRALMESFGYLTALALVKTAAIFVVGSLCYLSIFVEWVEAALKAVIFIYLFAAIIPWSFILLSYAS